MISVASTLSAPPGGAWFWQDGDHFLTGSDFMELATRVGAVLRAKGDASDPQQAILEHMAPRMPRGWAKGYDGPQEPTAGDMLRTARKIAAGHQVARADVIMRRMSVCASCPAMERKICLVCMHIPEKAVALFGGRRAPLPCDAKSGVCSCAKTFCMAVCTAMYPGEEPVWPGTPGSCWRTKR